MYVLRHKSYRALITSKSPLCGNGGEKGIKQASFCFQETYEMGIKYVDYPNSVKHVLRDHSKIDKTKVLKTNGSLMKVESIAECSLGAFCNTFDLH